MKTWRIVGIDFSHIHMGDLLREVHELDNAKIIGVCDRSIERMRSAIDNLGIDFASVFTDIDACLRATRPDLVILCPATAEHGALVEKVAPYGVDILIEKPFAASGAEADRMTAAAKRHNVRLAVNWPLAWYPPHVTTKRRIDKGAIGEPREVHFYDGNRGPLWHAADKVEVPHEDVAAAKAASWWYKKASGGGSLLDYLGYGVTLGTWFLGGRAPVSVTSAWDLSGALEVDEHSITVCRYATGLSKFETRWGTFTDPWTTQPLPKCGFVVGSEGTLSSYDFESHIGLQTREHPQVRLIPVDELKAPFRWPVEYVLDCKANDRAIAGPLDPAICCIGQRIVDTAFTSASAGRTLELLP
jgi:glucose-fructose oxidoreductase